MVVAEHTVDENDTISLADSFIATERSASPPTPSVYPHGQYPPPPPMWHVKRKPKKRTLKVNGKVPDVLHVLMYYGFRHNEIIDSKSIQSIQSLTLEEAC